MKALLTALAAVTFVAPSMVLAQHGQAGEHGKAFEKGKAGENGNGFGFNKGTRGECERAIQRANLQDEYVCVQNEDGTYSLAPRT